MLILILINNIILYYVYRRDPKSLVKPMKINDENDENKYNEKFEAKKAKAVRHILLIRHGQYHTDGITDNDRTLTELGKYDIANFCIVKDVLRKHVNIFYYYFCNMCICI